MRLLSPESSSSAETVNITKYHPLIIHLLCIYMVYLPSEINIDWFVHKKVTNIMTTKCQNHCRGTRGNSLVMTWWPTFRSSLTVFIYWVRSKRGALSFSSFMVISSWNKQANITMKHHQKHFLSTTMHPSRLVTNNSCFEWFNWYFCIKCHVRSTTILL